VEALPANPLTWHIDASRSKISPGHPGFADGQTGAVGPSGDHASLIGAEDEEVVFGPEKACDVSMAADLPLLTGDVHI
jgi:hypothetical protein